MFRPCLNFWCTVFRLRLDYVLTVFSLCLDSLWTVLRPLTTVFGLCSEMGLGVSLWTLVITLGTLWLIEAIPSRDWDPQVSVQTVLGSCLDSVWTIFKVCPDRIQTLFGLVKTPDVQCSDCVWTLFGLCLDHLQNVFELCQDCVKTPHMQCLDFTSEMDLGGSRWILVFTLETSWLM